MTEALRKIQPEGSHTEESGEEKKVLRKNGPVVLLQPARTLQRVGEAVESRD
jgi:hypothetical protein